MFFFRWAIYVTGKTAAPSTLRMTCLETRALGPRSILLYTGSVTKVIITFKSKGLLKTSRRNIVLSPLSSLFLNCNANLYLACILLFALLYYAIFSLKILNIKLPQLLTPLPPLPVTNRPNWYNCNHILFYRAQQKKVNLLQQFLKSENSLAEVVKQ